MADDKKRGQDRAEEAREAAQARGAAAHGRGGNPDKDEDTSDEEE